MYINDLPIQNSNGDKLEFYVYRDTLVKLIEAPKTITPLTIGIFGSWGAGKTSLMQMVWSEISADTSKRNYQTVWFDAWKYNKEAPLWRALMLRVLMEIRKDIENTPKDIENNLNKLNDLENSLYRSIEREELGNLEINWLELLKGSLETAVHVGISLVPGLNIAKEVLKDVQGKAIEDDPGKIFKAIERAKTKIHIEQIQSLEQFQDKFKELIKKYVQPHKLVVFIDDLDRCLPEKAIEVLETIKLFLDVEGCIFILGMDSAVIARAIELKYREFEQDMGENTESQHQVVINGIRYLEKIIQLPFHLPAIESDQMEGFVTSLVSHWPKSDCPKVFAQGLGNNPRQVKRAINTFLLLWDLSQEKKLSITPIRLAKLVVIQNIYPDLYNTLKNNPQLLSTLEEYYRTPKSKGSGGEAASSTVSLPPVLALYRENTVLQRLLTIVSFKLTEQSFSEAKKNIPKDILKLLKSLKDVEITGKEEFLAAVKQRIKETQLTRYEALILKYAESGLIFSNLSPEELGSYFTLARQAEVPQIEQISEQPTFVEPKLIVVSGENYWIGKYPVTNFEYWAFVKESSDPSLSKLGYPQNKENHPVVFVSWDDAKAYCDWLSKETDKAYRLPTKAEWMKAACKAGRIYPWGNKWSSDYANTMEGGKNDTTPVGQYSPKGDSWCGCSDMVGNVWEWCDEWYSDDKRFRILKGGAFNSKPSEAQCKEQNWDRPAAKYDNVGFRVVWDSQAGNKKQENSSITGDE